MLHHHRWRSVVVQMRDWFKDVALAIGLTLGVGGSIGGVAILFDFYLKGGL